MSILDDTLPRIAPLDQQAMVAAAARQERLTKPSGALGRLESLSVQLAGIAGLDRPRFDRRVVVVAAASHGVADEGVSAYPSAVTTQMVHNFLAGGAAINVLADNAGARLVVVDAGVAGELPAHPQLHDRKLARGTRNMLREPALPPGHARRIVEAGIEFVHTLGNDSSTLIALGEMGIGNTTSAAAITAATLGVAPELVTGRGTLIDDGRLRRKIAVIRQAIGLHHPDPRDGLHLLATLGGYEIGFLAGCCLGAAAKRMPVVLDGYITGVAALIAARLSPRVRDYLIAGHRSVEPGHRILLEHLELVPLLDLDLRLGEGSGAALALPIVVAAARLLDEMATFGEAGVSEKTEG